MGFFFGMVTGRDGVRLRFRRREREEMRCGQPSEVDLGSGGGQIGIWPFILLDDANGEEDGMRD